MRCAALLIALALPAAAHNGVDHATPEEAARHAAEAPDLPPVAPSPLPFDLGGDFRLIDQTGAERGPADPDGRMQLLFFGYANCPSICEVAMPMMAEVAVAMEAAGEPVTPVMITVDPERDTPGTMGAPLEAIHADFVGLTGDEAALREAYDAYRIERTLVADLPDHGPVYAHGSHIYLLSASGEPLTLLPPILSAERMAQIALVYAEGGS